MEAAQFLIFLLIFVIAIVTFLLVFVSLQVYFLIKDLRRILGRVDHLLKNIERTGEAIGDATQFLKSLRRGLGVFSAVFSRVKKKGGEK